MIEENAVASKHAERFSVIYCYPICIELCHSIWRTGKRGWFLSVFVQAHIVRMELGSRGLPEV